MPRYLQFLDAGMIFQEMAVELGWTTVASLDPDSFIARAKGLVKRGFKSKDAAEIAARGDHVREAR
jgi:hypothetical protein